MDKNGNRDTEQLSSDDFLSVDMSDHDTGPEGEGKTKRVTEKQKKRDRRNDCTECSLTHS